MSPPKISFTTSSRIQFYDESRRHHVLRPPVGSSFTTRIIVHTLIYNTHTHHTLVYNMICPSLAYHRENLPMIICLPISFTFNLFLARDQINVPSEAFLRLLKSDSVSLAWLESRSRCLATGTHAASTTCITTPGDRRYRHYSSPHNSGCSFTTYPGPQATYY